MEIISQYLGSIFAITALMLVALVSPGPDFAVIVKNSLLYSRRKALFTAFGIAVGILIHVTYTLLGLGLVISKTIWLFLTFKYLGASYLIYIGIKVLRARKQEMKFDEVKSKKEISSLGAFSNGFLTNALNPKAMLFFVSLFSLLIAPNTPGVVLLIYGIIIFLTTLAWFSFVAFCLSSKKSQKYFGEFGYMIDRITGGILVLLGLKLVTAK